MSIWDFVDPELAALAELLGANVGANRARFPEVYGAGVIGFDDGTLSVGLLVDHRYLGQTEAPPRLLPFPLREDLDLLNRLAEISAGARFDSVKGVFVWPIPPPSPTVAPGDAVSAAMTGRLGPQVRWGASRGVLTAGHVGAPVSAPAFVGATQIGTVVCSFNPAGSGATAGADVALIDTTASGTSFAGSPQRTIVPLPFSTLSFAGVVASQQPIVMGFLSWLSMPSINGTYGDTYMTDVGVTSQGDSGSLVTDASGNAVGLVVGGCGSVTSFVQSLDYQLDAVRKSSSTFASLRL